MSGQAGFISKASVMPHPAVQRVLRTGLVTDINIRFNPTTAVGDTGDTAVNEERLEEGRRVD